jgi:ethanolamine-phosphate phospho-lyase
MIHVGLLRQIVLPPTYLARCYELVRAGGGVCIADEVQTGFGRCGEHFWMFEAHKVVSRDCNTYVMLCCVH